jgi:outer membrane lipoprotein-sorting protein
MRSKNLTLSCKYLATLFLLTGWTVAEQPAKSHSDDPLKVVLERLDRTAAEFRSAEADFEWDAYQRVTEESEKQRGRVYFRKAGSETQMAADVTEPAPAKTVLFAGGKVQLYRPNIGRLDVYGTGKSNGAFEGFLVLGFGGSGRDLLKSFDVTYGGTEKINEVDTDRLELIPKGNKLRGMFNHIELWIDDRGVSIQQKLISPEGDYRLNRYSNVVLNKKIADSAFKLKISGKTQVVTH